MNFWGAGLPRLCGFLALWFSFFHLAGCGYHWRSSQDLLIVSVPYVVGDADGALTGELVRALTISGNANVNQFGALYRLEASVVSSAVETIGYRRDPQLTGGVQKNLLLSERRKTLMIEATLYEIASGKIAKGPCRIEASVDYDFIDGDSLQDLVFLGSNGVSQVTLPFSLGQLEAMDAAEEAAMRPLYGHLAQEIVDALFAESW